MMRRGKHVVRSKRHKVRIKKDDQVKVIAGRDKDKTGRVIEVDRVRGTVLVEGVSMIKRHTRPNPGQADQGRDRGEGEPHRDFECDGFDLRRTGDAGGLQDGRNRRLRAQRAHCEEDGRASGEEGVEESEDGGRKTQSHYKKSVIPALVKEFGYKNVMAVPKIDKVSVNIGLGEATQNGKLMDGAVNELTQIAGQKPVITKAKKSIAAFKLREGMAIGTMVTLRGDRMYEFLDRLMNVALPRVRDFRGVSSKSFDGRGNYTLGIKDQLIFPEIDYNKVEKVKGMNISITTTARTDAEGLALLKHMGMPFRQQ